jgi:T5SS/PEP-CTERM-associated repeat protein
MYLSQTIGTGRGSAQRFAVNGPKRIGRALLAGLALLIAAAPQSALASVLASGDVVPADDPFTVGLNEGLPIDGNFINPFEPVDGQTFYEGIHNDGSDPLDPTDDENENFDVFVGRSSFGVLLISGESALRFMNLVIGDEAELLNGQLRKGTGVVRITGFGSLYNNNPDILPPLPPNLAMDFRSVKPRTDEGGYEDGFDVYVGRAGTGTLEISAGARAEIHDAVIIGHLPGSSGSVIVDGFDSFLGSGGFEGSVVAGQPRQMIVGRQGVGFLTISAGATVVSESASTGAGGTDTIIGAVIGSEAFDESDSDQPPGGSGTATVTGIASKWIIGGSLQVGGFDRGSEGVLDDAEGDNVLYSNESGRGTLHVNDGGFVGLRQAIEADPDQVDLLLAIGRFGRVELAGGLISIGSGEEGGQGDARESSVQVLNDGVIRGFGRIETGVFNNRYFGEVRVDAGHRLVIDSSSQFAGSGVDAAPLSNYGLIQVIGTAEARAEIEFERGVDEMAAEPNQPFRNLFLAEPPLIGRAVGQITGAHSTMRFRSGLSNNGKLAFIAGDNFVSGPVVNEAGDPDPMNFSPPGEIAVAGNNTTVTFEHEFTGGGRFAIFPNSSLVIFENDFTQLASGTMAITLGGRPTGNELSFLSVMGDASLNGTLEVDLFSTGANPIDPMPGDEYEILAAMGTLSGIFTNLVMPNLGAGVAMVPVYDYLAGTVTLQVVGLAGVMGAVFNGDGFVDALDLAVWQMNVGIIGGATGAQGDADGDGDVDGDDFLLWQQTIGPVPGGGAGSGAGGQLVAGVPEPSSLLLVTIGSLALAGGRRRP